MRQGRRTLATASMLAVSLFSVPVWAGNVPGQELAPDVRSQQRAENQHLGLEPKPFLEVPMLKLDAGAGPSAIPPTDELVHDNLFEASTGGFFFANQSSTLDMGFGPPVANNPLSLLADEINLPAGTVVRSFKSRFIFGNGAPEPLDGVVVAFWDHDPAVQLPGAVNPGLGGPINATTLGVGVETFQVAATDPGFRLVEESITARRFEVSFNAGEQWVAPGGLQWVNITPVEPFPPQTFTFMARSQLGQFPSVMSFLPNFIEPGHIPDFWNPAEVEPGWQDRDTQFQLFGSRANGGTTVATLSGTPQGGCTIEVLVSQQPDSDCTPGACGADPILTGACKASYAVIGGDTLADVTAGLAANFNLANCGGPVVITMVSAGPRLIVTTDDGPRATLCVGNSVPPGDLIGGPNRCNQTICGMNAQVGLNDDESLPAILGAVDNLTTVKTCPNTANGTGTWIESSFPTGIFDYRPGYPPHKAIPTQRVPMSGRAVPFANDDADTLVERLDAIRFDECSGDFSTTGGIVFDPDGVVDGNDAASFTACIGQGGDCLFFDYDNSGAVVSPGTDADVFNCLLASGNDRDCCPATFDGNFANAANYPRTTTISSRLTRLQLRSCSPLIVERVGQNAWPECWWCDYYLSGIPSTGGCDELGTPCNNVEGGGEDDNDAALTADPVGSVRPATPVRVRGSLSSTNCDRQIPAQINPGQNDLDCYAFDVTQTDLICVSTRANGTAGACTGGCACGPNLAKPSVWVYDEDGLSLLGADDPGIPNEDPITSPTTDARVQVVLAPGTYLACVGSAAQFAVPAPGVPQVGASSKSCGIAQDGNVAADEAVTTTGDYELNLSVVQRSLMTVTQLNANGGTFDSRLLVSPLVTYWRVADPFGTIMVDDGELGLDAIALFSNDGAWANNVNLPGIFPGDEGCLDNDPDTSCFIPGVAADASNVQTEQQIQHVNVDIIGNPPGNPNDATVVHLVEVPHQRKCELIESGCVYIQAPNDENQDAIGAATSATLHFPAADDFTLASNTTIRSVTFWLANAGDAEEGTAVDLAFYLDGTVTGGCSGPGALAPGGGYPDTNPEVFRPTDLTDADRVTFNLEPPFEAVGGQKYWLEFSWDSVNGEGPQVFLMLSDAGDDVAYRDRGPLDTPNQPTATNCPDFSNIGNGYDCVPYVDDVATTNCDEAAEGNGDGDGDIVDINLAFCLGSATVSKFTKDLPWDVACGNWRTQTGGIVWNQPSDGLAGGTTDVSDLNGFSLVPGGEQCADDFTFFVSTTVTDIHWRGNYNTNAPEDTLNPGDKFEIQVWDDLNGKPGAIVKLYGVGNTLTEFDTMRMVGELTGNPGRIVYEYWYDISGDPLTPALIEPNKRYWLSIVNDLRGTPFNWFWTNSNGGDRNNVRHNRDIADAWGGASVNDHSFDLTAGGTDKIIAVKSIPCPPSMPIATGLGYYFDTQHAYINGIQTKVPGGEADQNRWRTVRAPWKHYFDIATSGPIPVAGTASVLAAFNDTGLEPPSNDDMAALIKDVAGKSIIGVFDAMAGFDVTADVYGVNVGGQIDRLCNGQIIDVGVPSDVLNERLLVKGLCFDNGVATAIVHPEAAPQCFDNFECERCNVCFVGVCDDGICDRIPNKYGDVNHDTTVSLFDLFCVLDGFADIFVNCSFEDIDINPCAGNGTVNLGDLFAVLNAFSDIDPCCACNPVPPAPGAPCPGGPACSAPAADRSGTSDLGITSNTAGDAPSLQLIPSRRTAHAGDVIEVAVYVDNVTDLRGYEIAVQTTGGRRGQLELLDAQIADRSDFVLNGVENVKATDPRGRVAGAAYSGGVSAKRAYLGTFTFQASTDAVGAFRVTLKRGNEVLTLANSNDESMPVGRISPAVILITTPTQGL